MSRLRSRTITVGALVLAALLGCSGGGGGAGGGSSTTTGTTGGTGGAMPADPDPGRVTLHRLNRNEYDNTVHDLLGTSLTPARDFPADDYSYGFDDIADALTISPLQLELYERAADALVTEALARPSLSAKTVVEAETLTSPQGSVSGSYFALWTTGTIGFSQAVTIPGKYRISTRVFGQQAGPDPVKMTISVGGIALGTFDITQVESAPTVVEVETMLPVGNQVVSVEFLNDYYDPATNADRNLVIDWIQVEGPLDVSKDNPIRDALLSCDPDTGGDPCVRTVIGEFARRAYRRPVTSEEVDGLMSLTAVAKAEGDTVDAQLSLPLRAILLSPHFLFRVELDPDPTANQPHPLGGFELASRLSYFIWSSMPDEPLFQAAANGDLDDVTKIAAQVKRMLDDPRADALLDNFAGEWLYTRALDDHLPDYKAFPTWDEELRLSMRQETRLFFKDLLHSDAGMAELLTTNFTYLNERLATHYGLDGLVTGPELVKVTLPAGSKRGGILTQGSFLTVTSYPARTSPVRRGKWILGQILCAEPPPPPPGVKGLTTEEVPTGSIRQRFEAHVADPACAGCHLSMDPLGFSLERYDGIGALRDTDQGFPIDTTGTLPSGAHFDDAAQMAEIIGKDPRFPRCVSEKFFTYALGRAPAPKDAPFLDHIEGELAGNGNKLKDLVRLIATSEPFRMRRGEPAKGGK